MIKHGHSKRGARAREYDVWAAMIQRCHNPNAYDYRWYGARGIAVCERWREYENFYADMGPRPSRFTIERVDNSKGYGPDNCVWAPWHGQAKNSRHARFISLEDETLCVSDMAALTGIRMGKIFGNYTVNSLFATSCGHQHSSKTPAFRKPCQ